MSSAKITGGATQGVAAKLERPVISAQSIYSAILLLGEFTSFIGASFAAIPRLWYRRGLFLRQCESIGVNSTGIVIVAGLFMGAVLGYQLYASFHYFGAEALLGGTMGISLFRELAPVMTGIMVTGRAGASMAAELASMRISEQIDALEIMAVDPIEFLVTPRVIASVVMVPLQSVLFAIVGSIMGAVIACGLMGLDWAVYWDQYKRFVDHIELVHCTLKGAMFGFVLSGIGCFNGFRAYGGALAVGSATRNTVVASCLGILLSDYILTSVLPYGFSRLRVL